MEDKERHWSRDRETMRETIAGKGKKERNYSSGKGNQERNYSMERETRR